MVVNLSLKINGTGRYSESFAHSYKSIIKITLIGGVSLICWPPSMGNH